MVTIGAASRAPQSMYVLIQNRGKTRTKSALRRKMSQGCSNVGCSKRRLSRRRFQRVSLTPTEATATAVSSPKEEREEGVREEECAVRMRAAQPQGARRAE